MAGVRHEPSAPLGQLTGSNSAARNVDGLPSSPASVRKAVTASYEKMLSQCDLPDGFALCGTGSFARREMTHYSDLDVTLLHADGIKSDVVASVAESVWYPLWDRNIPLDHSVRTVSGMISTASADMAAALSLVDLRFVTGDEELATSARAKIMADWRSSIPQRFDSLVASAASRWHRSGSVVAMTRPDLKHGRGGLRDAQLLRALALAQVANATVSDTDYQLLLDVRTLLHDSVRRARDILDPEFAADIAVAMGRGDRYALSEEVAAAARNIDAALTVGFSTARAALPSRTALRRPIRRPLDEGVVDHNGQIALARSVKMDDPGLPLRLAATATRTGLPVGEAVWTRLESCPRLPEPWPSSALSDFCAVLAGGDRTNDVVEAMDRHDLWEPIVAGWRRIRGVMPRERTHVLTLDKHALAVVKQAAENTIHVPRPDLLLLAALYHDLGKQTGDEDQPEDHSVVGARMVKDAARRMGLNPADARVLEVLVAHHTDLMRLALNRDPNDPETARELVDCVDSIPLVLDLLEVLTACDAQGTGPTVWTPRAAASVRRLARVARSQMRIAPLQHPDFAADVVDLKETSAPVEMQDDKHFWRLILDDDDPSALQRVINLMLDRKWHILQARIMCDEPTDKGLTQTVAMFALHPVHEGKPDNSVLQSLYAQQKSRQTRLPFTKDDAELVWNGDILEVRARDRLGVLAAVIGALPELRWATVSTFADTVVDQFGVKPGLTRKEKDAAVMRIRHALGD